MMFLCSSEKWRCALYIRYAVDIGFIDVMVVATGAFLPYRNVNILILYIIN